MEGGSASDQWSVADVEPGGDSVFFALKNAPGFVVATSEVPSAPLFFTNVVITPGPGTVGSYQFHVIARDLQNLATVETVLLTVLP